MEEINMFNKKFKIVEIHENGIVITNYLSGKKKEVDADIERFKMASISYEMMGKKGMIVWI